MEFLLRAVLITEVISALNCVCRSSVQETHAAHRPGDGFLCVSICCVFSPRLLFVPQLLFSVPTVALTWTLCASWTELYFFSWHFWSVFIWTLSGCFFPPDRFFFLLRFAQGFVLLWSQIMRLWKWILNSWWNPICWARLLFAIGCMHICAFLCFRNNFGIGWGKNICCWFVGCFFVLLNWYSFCFFVRPLPPLEYESMFSTLPKKNAALSICPKAGFIADALFTTEQMPSLLGLYTSKLKTDFGRPWPGRFDCSYIDAFCLYNICRLYLFLYNKKATGRFP